jgi:hypothetical protein
MANNHKLLRAEDVKLTKIPFEHSPTLLAYLEQCRTIEHYNLVQPVSEPAIDPDLDF